VFWRSHDPTRGTWCNQYKAILFFHGPQQETLARESRDRLQVTLGKLVTTEIRPAGIFTVAEDYHQKYALRNEPEILREFAAIYPDPRDLMNSTAAARVNGWLGGYGERDAVERDLPRLGLSRLAGDALLQEAH
jgi:hypothetical protein